MDPLRVSIPRNEMVIVFIALVISALYTLQTGNGKWAPVSLVVALALMVVGTTIVFRTKDVNNVFMLMLGVFVLGISVCMSGFLGAFYGTLPNELKDGYLTPARILWILYGGLALASILGIILLSNGIIVISQDLIGYYGIGLSIVITMALLSAGILASA